jgi:hypothetical protein
MGSGTTVAFLHNLFIHFYVRLLHNLLIHFICEVWDITHMWKKPEKQHPFTGRLRPIRLILYGEA